MTGHLPLAGMRVVDMSEGKGELCTRFLADLGAEVIFVEPLGGAVSRRYEPMIGDISLAFETHQANKLGLALDIQTQDGRESLLDLLALSDVFVETTAPGSLEPLGLDGPALQARYPRLIAISITDFGQTGPYRDYVGTGGVHLALGGALSRSGWPGLPPLLPPTALAYETSAVQAALCVCLAYWNRLATGVGDYLDFSTLEACAQVLDPGLGVTGTATPQGVGTVRGRPELRYLYPIFPCQDGHVRLCVLGARQWHGLRMWLGEPEEFADATYDAMAARFDARNRLYPLMAALFADQPAARLVADAQRFGVPLAVVGTPAGVLHDEHFAARQAFADLVVAGRSGRVPSGFVEIDGERAGLRSPAPAIGEHTDQIRAIVANASVPVTPVRAVPAALNRRPLAGIRVLDLGVIVVGAEVGRLLCDQGAEVIKVEATAYPDGTRHTLAGDAMNPTVARGHRGKLSIGLNLRTPEGRGLFKELVAKSDVIVSNFKPGTLDSLGLGFDILAEINPRLIMADSSALGSRGPKSRTMGYGPLVRAATGLTELWSYPDREESFSDAVTIFPDNFVARIVAVGALSLLIRRERTGRGGTVSVSQAESILMAFAPQFLRESLRPGTFRAAGNADEFHAPHGVYPCLGDDEWCVVTVRDDREWLALCTAIGRPELASQPGFASAPGRVTHRREIDAVVTAWTRQHPPREVMSLLQTVGVPAGMMLRVADLDADPHLVARDFARQLDQPGLPAPIATENALCRARHLPDPDIRPAPFMGQHTYQIAAGLLGLPDAQIRSLLASGVLEAPAPGTPQPKR
jgi:crotonobetainyl-CoA:carnitine CoA-transferase CaiB-like acyl-CoA transferase